MEALFGEEHAEQLRETLEGLRPFERELTVIDQFTKSLNEIGAEFVLPFRFKSAEGRRTSHYLIFLSKNVLGYKIMKDIMARQSKAEQGVPSFEYIPAGEQFQTLFPFFRPLDDLEDMLLVRFAGQHLTMKEIFDRHNVETPYVERNYKEALRKLEGAGRIVADPPSNKRRKGTFGDDVVVTFPPK